MELHLLLSIIWKRWLYVIPSKTATYQKCDLVSLSIKSGTRSHFWYVTVLEVPHVIMPLWQLWHTARIVGFNAECLNLFGKIIDMIFFQIFYKYLTTSITLIKSNKQFEFESTKLYNPQKIQFQFFYKHNTLIKTLVSALRGFAVFGIFPLSPQPAVVAISPASIQNTFIWFHLITYYNISGGFPIIRWYLAKRSAFYKVT